MRSAAFLAYCLTMRYARFRRDVGPDDVEFDIKFCGICHSDLHQARAVQGGAVLASSSTIDKILADQIHKVRNRVRSCVWVKLNHDCPELPEI